MFKQKISRVADGEPSLNFGSRGKPKQATQCDPRTKKQQVSGDEASAQESELINEFHGIS